MPFPFNENAPCCQTQSVCEPEKVGADTLAWLGLRL
jgi:hypothetical protein